MCLSKETHPVEAIQQELWVKWLACFPWFSQHGQEMLTPEMPICCIDIKYITEQTSFVYVIQDVSYLQITQTCQEQLQT